MSFSFNAAGRPKDLIREVGDQAANLDQVPNQFADAINEQLAALPDDAECTLVCHGHTGWTENQTTGQISLHATLDVRVAQPAAVERIVDTDPEVQPGPERFPKGFDGDPPPGEGAGTPSR